ncbi:hypothetical protein G5I_03504 [Acromyrmex echinatior]|uniref:Uncharacterized protein n=1 Tax=Acromyrmex echinatior TaxID=103372 RepID=F4WD54_ACREC|nr:hypothetical protein G5I_03504 [Acromyrmex echinatior]
MSDSEGSVASANGSEKSVTHDEIAETMPSKENHNGDKPEEFEKLLQSMVVAHSVSEEEEQVREEDNVNEKKIIVYVLSKHEKVQIKHFLLIRFLARFGGRFETTKPRTRNGDEVALKLKSEIPDLAHRILDHQFQCRARQKRGISHGDDDNGEEEAMPLDDLFREDMR